MGCMLQVKDYIPKISGMESVQDNLDGRVFELTEFQTHILRIQKPKGDYPHRMGCHASCLGFRGLRTDWPEDSDGRI